MESELGTSNAEESDRRSPHIFEVYMSTSWKSRCQIYNQHFVDAETIYMYEGLGNGTSRPQRSTFNVHVQPPLAARIAANASGFAQKI